MTTENIWHFAAFCREIKGGESTMEKYYKTELHAHTKPVSMCSDIDTKQLVKIYKENGYDSIVLTNHFITQLQGETAEERFIPAFTNEGV